MKRTSECRSTRLAGAIFEVHVIGKCFKDPYNTVSNLAKAWHCKIEA